MGKFDDEIAKKILCSTPTNHLWKPTIMETPYHLMETPNHLMETPYHLWKPFLKNKELPFLKIKKCLRKYIFSNNNANFILIKCTNSIYD
jgi:hypothetical protein